jgi:hypothetical protein
VTYVIVISAWILAIAGPVAIPNLIADRRLLARYSIWASAVVAVLWAVHFGTLPRAAHEERMIVVGLSAISALHIIGLGGGWLRSWSSFSQSSMPLVLWRITLAVPLLFGLTVLAVLSTNPFYGSSWKGVALLALALVLAIWAILPALRMRQRKRSDYA